MLFAVVRPLRWKSNGGVVELEKSGDGLGSTTDPVRSQLPLPPVSVGVLDQMSEFLMAVVPELHATPATPDKVEFFATVLSWKPGPPAISVVLVLNETAGEVPPDALAIIKQLVMAYCDDDKAIPPPALELMRSLSSVT